MALADKIGKPKKPAKAGDVKGLVSSIMRKEESPVKTMMGPVKKPNKTYDSKEDLPEVTVKGRKYSLIDYLQESGILDGVQTAANIAQLGSFIPHPAAQVIGRVGAGVSAGISGIQAASDYSEGNYGDAAANVIGTAISSAIGRGVYRKNPKYLPEDSLFGMLDKGRRTKYLNVDKRVRKQTKRELAANRIMLGGVAAETIYNDTKKKK
jgi:hypothetical protein